MKLIIPALEENKAIAEISFLLSARQKTGE